MQRSFITSACESDSPFPLNNLPYGIFSHRNSQHSRSVGVAIGDHVLDLHALATTLPELFPGPHLPPTIATSVFSSSYLNSLLELGKPVWTELRAMLKDALSESPQTHKALINADQAVKSQLLPKMEHVEMHLPAQIGDYTDFYSSRQHAFNVGSMFRDPANALPPNWEHIPIGYHGRASSVIPTGKSIHRPMGQLRPVATDPPIFAPSKMLDFELEMGALIGGKENQLGTSIPIDEVGDRVFGLVLLNDWSARDVQKWEYVPLGPFNSKNFATTIGVWVIPLEALEDFRGPPSKMNQAILPYLQAGDVRAHCTWDVELSVKLQTSAQETPSTICKSNLKNLYWSVAQQLAHHSICGCNLRPGDLIGSGTISGPEPENFGSMLELSWKGSKPIELENSEESRKFIQDGDTIYLCGTARGNGYSIGFGECKGTVLAARKN